MMSQHAHQFVEMVSKCILNHEMMGIIQITKAVLVIEQARSMDGTDQEATVQPLIIE